MSQRSTNGQGLRSHVTLCRAFSQDGSDGQDEDEKNELLESMSPTQHWVPPPLNPPLPPEADPCAAGEESTERDAQSQREQMFAAFPPVQLPMEPHQMPQDPFDLAYPEPDQPLDYAVSVMILLTPKEIQDQQAAQQQQQMGPPPGFHPDPNANLMQHQLPYELPPQQGLPGFAAPPFQGTGPMQQPGGLGQYLAPQQPRPPGGPAPYPLVQQKGPSQQAPGQINEGPPFRGPPGAPQPPSAPPQHQGPPVMRPLQVLILISFASGVLVLQASICPVYPQRCAIKAC